MKITPGYGRRVELVRQDTQLGKQAFARFALSDGASAKNISRIEIEEVTPKAMTLAKIAAFGGVSMEWLARGEMTLKPNDIVRTGGVGARIAEARRRRGLTRNALARMAKLGNTTKNISRLEQREHMPRARTIVKIAEVLKVSPRYLAYGA